PISDRVIVMERGRIIADCPPRELRLPEGHEMAAAMPAAARIFALAGGKGSAPLTVGEGRANRQVRDYLKANAPAARELPQRKDKPLLRAKELYAGYGGADVLRGASLSLYRGELYALLGGNGSGKSTLLKALCGIKKPRGGRVIAEKGARVGYLPQNPCALFGEETALQELTERKVSPERARELLSRMEFAEELFSRHPLDLSGGERQKLALAVLFSEEPDVLLLDEPTKGMDAFAKQDFAALLRGISRDGCGVLMVTHDAEFAALCADRCGLLFNGEVVSEGIPADFFAKNYFYTTPLSRLAQGIARGWA
ncbi:MAG: ATP-binding cassette domain-containing protein, partial [Oscillospiraceae bacterium]